MTSINYGSCIKSVEDEVPYRINSHSGLSDASSPTRSAEAVTLTPVHYDFSCRPDSDSGVSSDPATRADKGRLSCGAKAYVLSEDAEILRIITEIDSGRLLSKPSWVRGSEHHPCSPTPFKIRRYLSTKGPQSRDQMVSYLGIQALDALDELQEQGIIYTL
jgi:hypothetical protein